MTEIYQTKDTDNTIASWVGAKPILDDEGNWYDANNDCEYEFNYLLFPAVPDRGEILEIIINEDGTWKSKKVYENGFYLAKGYLSENDEIIIVHSNGEWFHRNGAKIFQPELFVKIANKKIPDECLV